VPPPAGSKSLIVKTGPPTFGPGESARIAAQASENRKTMRVLPSFTPEMCKLNFPETALHK
jgi:hypothetical protein